MATICDGSQYFRQSLQQSVSNHFGDYEVTDQINHGGFGHIFKLVERKTKRVYALKVLDRTRKGQQAKIKNQINIHQSLKSRYILQLNNKFHDEINFYMVLQYCEQGDLFTYMANNYPNVGMPIELVQKFTQQIAKGISYLHKQDIVHGDIKPSNILLNQKLQVKICDFGLSTKRKNKQKVNGAKGTLNYLAPECIFPYDEKVDIWALGVLIFYISTGVLPFQISNYKQLTQILTQERLRKFIYPEKLPPKLKDLLKKIFVFDPKNRFSIQEVLSHPFITGQQLEIPEQKQKQSVPRMRSHASSTVQSIQKYDSSKNTLKNNQQIIKSNARKTRPNSQNRDHNPIKLRQTKQNYMGKILEKKTKIMQKNVETQYHFENKENNLNAENTKNNLKISQKLVKTERDETKPKTSSIKRYIEPLKTQGMVVKPIIQKNCVIKIDNQGICRRKQEVNDEGMTIFKEIKISPDGRAIYMKINKEEKFYTIESLPQKFYKQYDMCKKIIESVKNHTPKLQFSRKTLKPVPKDIKLTVMYSGKVIGSVNGIKVQSSQKQLQQEFITFAQNNQNAITQQQLVRHEIKCIYQKLISL